jgi:hypothetical protein
MTHLSPEQIVDVAEGCADAASAAHAAGCEPCRAKVEALLDAVRLADSDPRPEPSPIFWTHLAARIGDAVRREHAAARSRWSWGWRLVPLGAAAVLLIAAAVGLHMRNGPPPGLVVPAPVSRAAGSPQPAPERLADGEPTDDPSWLLVSALSAEVSIDDAEAFGAIPPPGGADQALLQLDDAERMELAKILRDAIGAEAGGRSQKPGA